MPPAQPSSVTTATSAKRTSPIPSVEPGVEAEPADEQDRSCPRPTSGIEWPGIARGLPSGAVLALARAEQEQGREGAGGADQVHRRRAGEVLHAGGHQRGVAVLEPAAAEHPVRADRVDERGEHDRVDHVRAVLDPLERGAPDDRKRHGAERELEQPLRPRRWRRRRPSPGTPWLRSPENCRKNPLLPTIELEMPSTSALPKANAKPTAQ